MKDIWGFVAVLITWAVVVAQTPMGASNPLLRTYRDGETLTYHMTGVNEDWHYQIQADGVVRKDPSGVWAEEYRWSNLISDGRPVPLAPSTADFRQSVTLDPSRNPAPPDLTKVDPRLIGPITDFMTFYVDLWLANKTRQLHHAGDHFYMPNGMPSSWADGTHVIHGESAIDFDLTLKSIDETHRTAALLVRHVPPQKPSVRLDADWMRTPAGETPNNWVGITKAQDGKYEAGAGKETFEVAITISTVDGRILAGDLDNVVQTIQRTCNDAALTHCGDPHPHTIRRHIQIALQPHTGQ